MGKQAKINEIQKHIAAKAAANGKAQQAVTNRLSPQAWQRIVALDQQIAVAKNAFQQFFDGVIMGVGIDIEANTVNLNNDGTYTITPKEEANAQSTVQETGGLPDEQGQPADAEPES